MPRKTHPSPMLVNPDADVEAWTDGIEAVSSEILKGLDSGTFPARHPDYPKFSQLVERLEGMKPAPVSLPDLVMNGGTPPPSPPPA